MEYLSGMEPGVVSVPYTVDDGQGGTTPGSVDVEVVGPLDSRPRNPVTQPDVIRGVVGKPIQVEPLSNDIPGADPGDPEAEMLPDQISRALLDTVMDRFFFQSTWFVGPTTCNERSARPSIR